MATSAEVTASLAITTVEITTTTVVVEEREGAQASSEKKTAEAPAADLAASVGKNEGAQASSEKKTADAPAADVAASASGTAETTGATVALKPVYFPWQAGQPEKPAVPLTPEEEDEQEARRLGRLAVLVLFVFFTGALVLAIFVSIYRSVHAPPRVWIPIEATEKKGYVMKPARLLTCVQRLRSLDEEMENESKHLWYRMRVGNRHALRVWQDWSRDWQQRMELLNKQCPLRGDDDISRSFRRASKRMLELHKRQEKAFTRFFSDTAWLFREVREGLHVLKEELRP
jgi:hypothetical protein